VGGDATAIQQGNVRRTFKSMRRWFKSALKETDTGQRKRRTTTTRQHRLTDKEMGRKTNTNEEEQQHRI
jgi:hypothetical protein